MNKQKQKTKSDYQSFLLLMFYLSCLIVLVFGCIELGKWLVDMINSWFA